LILGSQIFFVFPARKKLFAEELPENSSPNLIVHSNLVFKKTNKSLLENILSGLFLVGIFFARKFFV
jgi:hypothetical protein